MADILGVTNPVPGHDKTVNNRVPSNAENQNNLRLQNVVDPNRVSRADARTERQNAGQEGRVRYDSNYQTFLQRLQQTPGMAESLRSILSGQSTVVLSGMKDGVAAEMAQLMQMMHMDEGQLLAFLKGQAQLGTRFGGALFALLRGAYGKASSEQVQNNILQFLKAYADNSSSTHLEGNILRNLSQMAGAMPGKWGQQLNSLMAQLQNSFAAGDREGSIQLLQKEIFPFMSRYVEQTHDMGKPRQLLSMMALDLARYENGSVEKLLEMFHHLRGFGTLKGQLGGLDDSALLQILQQAQDKANSSAMQFSNQLLSAATRALRGEGSMEVQQGFQNLIAAMLLNESVYMPLNHMLIPLEWDGRMLFSELWTDPDAEGQGGGQDGEGKVLRFLLKVDVQDLGLFDVVLTAQQKNVDIQIACPDKAASASAQMEQAITEILKRNDLTPTRVSVRRMERPLALTEVFPKLYSGRNGVNVKA